jgi:class 3 adenylate cyclase
MFGASDQGSSISHRSRPQRQGRFRQLLKVLAIGLIYFLVSSAAKKILAESDPSPIWPLAGLALVATYRYRYAGAAGIFLGDFFFNTSSHLFGFTSLLMSLAAVAQGSLGAWFLTLSKQRDLFSRLRDSLGLLLLATFASTLINPSLSVLVMLRLQNLHPSLVLNTWLTYWLGDSMGVLVFAPVLLQWREIWPSLRTRLWEALLCFGLIVAASLLIFFAPAQSPLNDYRGEYLPFGLMIWAALQFRLPGAALASCLIAVIAILGAQSGHGPFVAQAPDLPTAILTLQGFMVFLTVIALTLATAEIQLRATERQRANLSRYLPPSLVDTLANSSSPFGNDRQEQVAILYADLTGFSTLIETLPPEAVLETLRQFYARMETQVFEHQGILERYTGDGLVAVFGTPQVTPKAASCALACARAMVREINSYNAQRVITGQPLLLLGIGIDYGRVMMGNVGTERCMSFMATGKVIKVVIRLKDLCTRYQVDIFISKALADQVERESGPASRLLHKFISLGKQGLLGMSKPIAVLGLPSEHPSLFPPEPDPDALEPGETAPEETAPEAQADDPSDLPVTLTADSD